MRKSESAAKPSSALMGISYQVFSASQQAAVRVGLVSGSVGQRGVVAPLPRLILSVRKRTSGCSRRHAARRSRFSPMRIPRGAGRGKNAAWRPKDPLNWDWGGRGALCMAPHTLLEALAPLSPGFSFCVRNDPNLPRIVSMDPRPLKGISPPGLGAAGPRPCGDAGRGSRWASRLR